MARRSAILIALVVVAAASATVALGASAKTYFPSKCTNQVIRPHRVTIACGDGNLYATHLSWHNWNHSSAHARGRGYLNSCNPNCASGKFHRYAIAVRVYRPRLCSATNKRQYTRLDYSFVGRHKPAAHGENPGDDL